LWDRPKTLGILFDVANWGCPQGIFVFPSLPLTLTAIERGFEAEVFIGQMPNQGHRSTEGTLVSICNAIIW